jgi:hypothetical protein
MMLAISAVKMRANRRRADALFSVWLGPNPVQEDLKKALLGS